MATLKDVAKEAGLTVTTVSRVLNNRGYISEDARKKVKDAMTKLNYRPNEVARSLHSKSSNTIGIIVPHIRHPYFAEMISQLENAAYDKGYKVLLCNSQSTNDRAREYVDICSSNRVAGIILCSGNVSTDIFSSLDVPIIAIERDLESSTALIECDNYQGGRQAALCLKEAGCKNIIYFGISGNPSMPAEQRSIGFREVCDSAGISISQVDPGPQDFESMEYDQIIEDAILSHPDTDGIFASSDIIAAQVLRCCHKKGIQVPNQIKVIGFDDIFVSRLTNPSLSSIHQPIKEMAIAAIDVLQKAIAGEPFKTKTTLPVTLIPRDSTGAFQGNLV